MPTADPNVKLVFAKVRNIRQEICRIVVHRLAGQEPADMGPKTAFAWRMRVAFLVCALVMLTMCRNPKDRTTFQSQSGAHGQKVFHPLRSFVATMREKAMISHAYTKTAGDPPQDHGDQESLPTEEEQ